VFSGIATNSRYEQKNRRKRILCTEKVIESQRHHFKFENGAFDSPTEDGSFEISQFEKKRPIV